MQLNRIRVSEQADNALRHLKARTGLTPNLLCRIGFCLSLRDPALADPALYDENGREFNRYTLTGQWDPLFVALLNERRRTDRTSLEDSEKQFVAHINRGVLVLLRRVKNIGDLCNLVEMGKLHG